YVVLVECRGYRTPGLGLRLVKTRFDHQVLPRMLGVEHAAEFAAARHGATDLLDCGARIGCVVDHAEGIHKVEIFIGQKLGQCLSVPHQEPSAEAEDFESLASDIETGFR